MSWQAYVDSNLIGSGQITQAGIYGLQGGQWAASSGFNVSFENGIFFIILVASNLRLRCSLVGDAYALQEREIRATARMAMVYVAHAHLF